MPAGSNRTRGMNWDVEIADVLRAVDRAKEELVIPDKSHDFFCSSLSIEPELAERYQEFFILYEKVKQKDKLYDLSDLIYVPLLLLESSPSFVRRGRHATTIYKLTRLRIRIHHSTNSFSI